MHGQWHGRGQSRTRGMTTRRSHLGEVEKTAQDRRPRRAVLEKSRRRPVTACTSGPHLTAGPSRIPGARTGSTRSNGGPLENDGHPEVSSPALQSIQSSRNQLATARKSPELRCSRVAHLRRPHEASSVHAMYKQKRPRSYGHDDWPGGPRFSLSCPSRRNRRSTGVDCPRHAGQSEARRARKTTGT